MPRSCTIGGITSINIEGHGTIRTIVVTKHLDNNTKHPKVLLIYNFVNIITNEEKDMLLLVEPNLFAINTITLPKPKISATMFECKNWY
jgi:hypothetical protein